MKNKNHRGSDLMNTQTFQTKATNLPNFHEKKSKTEKRADSKWVFYWLCVKIYKLCTKTAASLAESECITTLVNRPKKDENSITIIISNSKVMFIECCNYCYRYRRIVSKLLFNKSAYKHIRTIHEVEVRARVTELNVLTLFKIIH